MPVLPMPLRRPHPWTLFLLLSLVAFTVLAAEPREVGRVLVASGEVTATREGASTRALGRGDRLYEGDAITTGPGARAQLRLSDEGLVQLAADTEYRIEHYRAQGEERGAVTELVEGGLRTVTGAIGDDDPEDYQLDTPVATIGIRGTRFALHHSDDSGTVGEVAEGAIVVENDGGGTEVGAGQFFAVRSRDQAPQELEQRPQQLDTGSEVEDGSGAAEEEFEGGGDEGDREEGEAGGEEQASEGRDENAGDDPVESEGPSEDPSESSTPGGDTADGEDAFGVDGEEPAYSAGEDEGTRERAEDEGSDIDTGSGGSIDDGTTDDGTSDNGDTVVTTPWYEDDSLTKFGMTGLLGGPWQSPGYVTDGEPHPVNGKVESLTLDDEGWLEEMIYYRVESGMLIPGGDLEGGQEATLDSYGFEKVVMRAESGAKPAQTGSASGLGVHWGRWNLGDYEQVVDGNIMISPDGEEGPPPGTDWHWLVLENAEDLMTSAQYDTLSGTDVDFVWAGGTEIRATDLDGVAEYTYAVDEFTLTADFKADTFTGGTLRLVTDDDAPEFAIDGQEVTMHGPEMDPALDASFMVSLQDSDSTDSAWVEGFFIGEEADGAGVTFSINTEQNVQGLEGVGVLERQ
ncbi:FecR family protein [Thiohalospira halophila DSM 15071]|uniref:FecR family protein n=1 Tax=Thiohalospira halophila DSM 15071 TaxID=1123397 RepID=A0A1I1QK49_9GAMM|nr:FecR domain-containing protein [Thiohalospira halophila]SFD22511.1 FecR family protein [Thiohalospira halophila DSM 15071]